MDPTTLAYIAGFLDGDGSIFFQLVRRKDYAFGFQIRSSLSFYQKTDHVEQLYWLQSQLKCGYLRHRKTGISDYTVVVPNDVHAILQQLRPYVRLKKAQVDLGLRILTERSAAKSVEAFLRRCDLVDQFQVLNYSKKRTVTADVVRQFLVDKFPYAPVETSLYTGESPHLDLTSQNLCEG